MRKTVEITNSPSIFDIVNDILYKKSGGSLYEAYDSFEYSKWQVLRFLSMHSDPRVKEISMTYEKYKNSIEDNVLFYKMLFKIVPKVRWEKMEFLKKEEEPDAIKEDGNYEMKIKTKIIDL